MNKSDSERLIKSVYASKLVTRFFPIATWLNGYEKTAASANFDRHLLEIWYNMP